MPGEGGSPAVFLDVETTGRDPQKDRVIELGIVVGTFAGDPDATEVDVDLSA